MPTIPKLNLAKGLTPEELSSLLNRWADHVTTALNEVDSHTNSTNQLTLAQRDFITKVPLVTVNGGSGNMQQQPVVSPSPRKPPLPGPPKPVGQDNLPDGNGSGGGRFKRVDHVTGTNRVSIASLLGDTSSDIATNLIDGGNKRFLHPMMSTGTQAVATSGGSIQNTAPVVGHPSVNIGVALQKLNSSGLLLDVDQIAAQGSVHKVVSAIDTNERALIDFTKVGHIGSLSNFYEMVQAAKPVAYYRLGEKSGTTLYDSGPNTLHGGYSTSALLNQESAILGEQSSPVSDGSVYFNNAAGAAGQVSFSSTLNPSVFSVACWVLPHDTLTQNEFIMHSKEPAGAEVRGYALDFFGGQVLANICTGSSQSTLTGPTFSTFVWHHVVLTYDGTNARLYTDGVLQATLATAFSPATSVAFTIGANSSLTENFHGNVDELAVFNYALTAQQISGFYQAGSVGPHRTVDDVPDGTTYNRFKAANMFQGGATSAHICNQVGALVTQTTLLSFDGDLSAGTWTKVATATIQLAPGTNSITLKVSCGTQGAGAATAKYNGIGFAVYSGTAPSIPQVSQSFTAGAGLSTTSLTLNNPTTGIVSLSLYVSDNGVVNANPPAAATPAALFQNLVTAFANGVLT